MANPIATILSSAMMLRYSLGLIKEAEVVEKAVNKVLDDGYRTYDIMSDDTTKVGTREMGDLITNRI
jgi:3-isopropylmalate dehydrogenase